VERRTPPGRAQRQTRPGCGPASQRTFVNGTVVILIWVAVIGVAFGVAWRKGYVQRLRDYVHETREELKKCTWPTWDELKGSTIIVAISIALLGGFTFVVNLVFVKIMFWISKV
jgi:preprotein translocase subunit SecE